MPTKKKTTKKIVAKSKPLKICSWCYPDSLLSAKDQFGRPRGTDVRNDHGFDYCGTCGAAGGITTI